MVTSLLCFREAFQSGQEALSLQTEVLSGAKLLFKTDLKKGMTVYREVFNCLLRLVSSIDSHLLKSSLWSDFYATVCQYYLIYGSVEGLLERSQSRYSLATAYDRRFELGLSSVNLDGHPLFTVIYNRPGVAITTGTMVDKTVILTIDDIVSGSLKLL